MMARLIIKISGESLGEQNAGIWQRNVQQILDMILPVYQVVHQVSIVFGGGNWMRGEQYDFQCHCRSNCDECLWRLLRCYMTGSSKRVYVG